MEFVQTYCVLDELGRFVYTGGDWDSFALENGGEDCTGDKIAGRHVFDGVKGFETRSFLNAAIFAVRDRNRQFVMDYRCDSPGIRRFMRMTISPLRNGRLLMVHDFVHEERMGDPGPSWLFAPDAKARKCSICCSVEFGEVWMDPFTAPVPHPHHVTYGMCPDCKRTMAGKLDVAGRVPGLETKVVRFPAAGSRRG